MFFLLQKLFLFSEKSNFRILHLQISWPHHIPEHETRNAFHWITRELNNTLFKWNLDSLCHITKEIMCKELGTWTFWSNLLTLISNISRLLQKFHFPVEVVLNYLQTQKGNRKVIEIGPNQHVCWPPQISFYRGFFEN